MKEFMKKVLFRNNHVKDFLTYMEKKEMEVWVAGGAITSIATGKQDTIDDYDVYFKDKYTCAEAIRYMKDLNPHVGFVSDKSITYVFGGETKIQFIFYSFYDTVQDIFTHFDFHCCMGAYSTLEKDFIYDEMFWLNNSQKFLTINPKTEFPILTILRLDKYKGKGYSTSRNEVLKLGLRVSSLNIKTWEEFKKHIGNSYGFTLADLKDCEEEEFTIDKAIDKLLTPSEVEAYHEAQYQYPHDVLDFIVLNEPLKVVTLNEVEYYLDPECQDVEDSLNILVEDGDLIKVEVDKKDILNKDYYTLINEFDKDKEIIKWTNTWSGGLRTYQKDTLPSFTHERDKVLVKIKPFGEGVISRFSGGVLVLNEFEVESVICRATQLADFKKEVGVDYKRRVRSTQAGSVSPKGWAFSGNESFEQGKIAQIKSDKEEILKISVLITNSNPQYAHKTFSGFILEGGENLTPYEILLYADGFNLCFGGDLTLREDGSFSGRYNTD